MPKQAAQNLHKTERRIDRQIARIRELEDAGRLGDARRARETLAVITETRDALRLRLKVASKVQATEVKWGRPAAGRLGRTADRRVVMGEAQRATRQSTAAGADQVFDRVGNG